MGIVPDRERVTGGLWEVENSPGEGEKENRHILPPAITNVTLTLPKQRYLDWHREKHNLSRSGCVSGNLSAALSGKWSFSKVDLGSVLLLLWTLNESCDPSVCPFP